MTERKTILVTAKVTPELEADFPAIREYIDSRLMEMLATTGKLRGGVVGQVKIKRVTYIRPEEEGAA